MKPKHKAIAIAMAEFLEDNEWNIRENWIYCPTCSAYGNITPYCAECGFNLPQTVSFSEATLELLYHAYREGRKAG